MLFRSGERVKNMIVKANEVNEEGIVTKDVEVAPWEVNDLLEEQKKIDFKKRFATAQIAIKAPKDGWNDYGNYKYRSAEQIYEAAKPILNEQGLVLVVEDELVEIGGKIFVKAEACIDDIVSDNGVKTYAYAMVSEHKGMTGDQATGTASSYARKYALNGLFLLDDTKDADTNEFHEEQQAREAEEKKQTEAAQNKSITKAEENALVKKIGDDAAVLNYILKFFKVSKLSDLKAGHLVRINNQWESLIGAAHGGKN